MSRESYLTQLKPADRDFLINLALSDAADSDLFPLGSSERKSVNPAKKESGMVNQLKTELLEERREGLRLRKECEELKEKLGTEKEVGEKLSRDQEARINVIGERFKEVMAENLKLKKQIAFSLKHYEENSAQTGSAVQALSTLRQLLLDLIEKENVRKKKDIYEKRFWDSLCPEVLISESEPPYEFSMETGGLEKPKSSKNEVEKRKKEEMLTQFRRRIDQLERENATLTTSKRDLKRTYDQETDKLKRQLVGSVRRIQYLLKEKTQLSNEKLQIQEYCAKIEAKLLVSAGSSSRKTSKSGSEAGSRTPGGVIEESQGLDLKVDKRRLMDLIESESGDVSEEVLKRVQEASWSDSQA